MIFSGVLIVRTLQGESRIDMEQIVKRILNSSEFPLAVIQVHFENGVPEEIDTV